MTVTKSDKDVQAFVADLRKTKGGVSVEETGDETIIRTRDGDVHRFKVTKAKAKAD